MKAKDKNDEDGGPTDWMTDTKPQVEKNIIGLKKSMEETFAAAAQPLGAMKSANDWYKEYKLAQGLNFPWHEFAVLCNMIQQDAIASQQPAPSGDARELYDLLNRTWGVGAESVCLAAIQSFATATREKALEEAAKWHDKQADINCNIGLACRPSNRTNPDFCFAKDAQYTHEASAVEIRALAKRGG